MGFVKRLTSAFVLICIAFTLCACGAKGSERIYFSVEKMPETLDAQLVSSDSELIVARNIYEGLFRQNEKGEAVPAAVETYDYSGLTYTFRLRDGLMWSDGQPLIADDFVFGIKRALLPETRAPFASLLYAVSGAVELNFGGAVVTPASAQSLGISAPDDKTLIITLAYHDKDFLTALSMPVSMPCREDFFLESTGKYGLGKEYVLSCGSYRLARWNKEGEGIRLYKNQYYTGEFVPKNGGVFISKDKEKTVAGKLISGDSDIALIPTKYLPDIEGAEGIKTARVQNICWILALGGDLTPNTRIALCKCISGDVYGKNLPPGFTVAKSVYPGSLGNPDVSYEPFYDPEGARALISEEIKQFKNKKFPPTTLIYSESEPLRSVITGLVGDWQKNLSTFINIKATDKSLESELKEHSLPLAAFPVKADSTLSEYNSKIGAVEAYNTVPLVFEDTTLGYLGNISGVYMNPTGGYIDFSFVSKK